MVEKQEKAAPRYLGLWIDHHVARIVELAAPGRAPTRSVEQGDGGGGARVETIESGVDRRHSQGGTAHLFRGGWQVSAPSRERSIDRAFHGRLTRFYKAVAARLQGAARVWVVGPGQAKTEFLKVLESCSIGASTLAEDAAAAMAKISDRQLIAKVREHFQPQTMTLAPLVQRRQHRRLNLGLNHHSYGAERAAQRRRDRR